MEDTQIDEIKRKVRKLKQLEKKVRFGKIDQITKDLVWDSFFDLHENSVSKAKFTLEMLISMGKEEYKRIVAEYLSLVYYKLYIANGLLGLKGNYDPDALVKLDLPLSADEADIKKRFRELAKKYHPDTGGNSEKFIELMDNYKKLTDKT